MNNLKTVKALEGSNFLLKSVTKTITMKQENKMKDFLVFYYALWELVC